MPDPTMIIDPPVSAYSPPAAIEAWLDELREMEPAPEVQDAIRQAEEWLRDANERAK